MNIFLKIRSNNIRKIQITKGYETIVDDEDYEELSKYKWFYTKGYVKRSTLKISGKRYTLSMHIQILGKREGFEIDHINGDKLDNRKCNLRYVTHTQNMQNTNSNRLITSNYKGIYWCKPSNRWKTRITIDGKVYYLGCYKSEQDAAWVYNVWAESFFGEYARLNIINN